MVSLIKGNVERKRDKDPRQRPIDNFIVDFYIPKHNLVIEIDGETHFEEGAIEYDDERTKILEGYGLTILRFTNLEVHKNIEGVYGKIQKYMR